MPIVNEEFKVKFGTESEYNSLSVHDPNAVYFLTDTGVIILSEKIYSGPEVTFNYEGHVDSVSDLPQGKVNSVYSVGSHNKLYRFDTEWTPLSSGIDSIDELSEVVATSINEDDKLATISLVKDIVESLPVDSELSSTSLNPVQNKVVSQALDEKVDKEQNRGLSENDFTDAYLNKLKAIQLDGSQVQSDWNETNDALASFIKNKPTIGSSLSGDTDLVTREGVKVVTDDLQDQITNLPTITVDDQLSKESENPVQNKVIASKISDIDDAVESINRDKVDKEENKGLSSNDFTDDDKDKLSDIESRAQRNVIPDWDAEPVQYTYPPPEDDEAISYGVYPPPLYMSEFDASEGQVEIDITTEEDLSSYTYYALVMQDDFTEYPKSKMSLDIEAKKVVLSEALSEGTSYLLVIGSNFDGEVLSVKDDNTEEPAEYSELSSIIPSIPPGVVSLDAVTFEHTYTVTISSPGYIKNKPDLPKYNIVRRGLTPNADDSYTITVGVDDTTPVPPKDNSQFITVINAESGGIYPEVQVPILIRDKVSGAFNTGVGILPDSGDNIVAVMVSISPSQASIEITCSGMKFDMSTTYDIDMSTVHVYEVEV